MSIKSNVVSLPLPNEIIVPTGIDVSVLLDHQDAVAALAVHFMGGDWAKTEEKVKKLWRNNITAMAMAGQAVGKRVASEKQETQK